MSLKGILSTNSAPLVSKDFNHNPHSSIFDLTQTQVIKGKFSRVLSWYDNEWVFQIECAIPLFKSQDLFNYFQLPQLILMYERVLRKNPLLMRNCL